MIARPSHFTKCTSLFTRHLHSRADRASIHKVYIGRRYEVASSLRNLATEEDYLHSGSQRLGALTKLICTIGPASHSPEKIQDLVNEGMRIMRINCSHATREEMEERVQWLRQCTGLHGCQKNDEKKPSNLRAVMFDTKGPELRTGVLPGGTPLTLQRNQSVVVSSLSSSSSSSSSSNNNNNNNNKYNNNSAPPSFDIELSHENISDVVNVNQSILLDDGLIELIVAEKRSDGTLLCEVQNDGVLGDRKGVNIPGAKLEMPAMTDLDREHLSIAVDLDADFIAASFVRKASDVIQIRSFLQEMYDAHPMYDKKHPLPKIIAKIESAESLQNFDEILNVSDGIMIARFDLAIEIPFTVVTRAQKMIVSKCNLAGKPVIVATQMLESMLESPRPTRAEVSDVVNAVYDGADCLMLSAESAKGKFPIETCQTLARIARQADMTYSEYSVDIDVRRRIGGDKSEVDVTRSKSVAWKLKPRVLGLARSTVQAARDAEVDLIIVISSTGTTAEMLSAEKGPVPIMAFVGSAKVGRQLMTHRGVWPAFRALQTTIPNEEKFPSNQSRMLKKEALDMLQHELNMVRPKQAVKMAKDLNMVQTGDTVLIVMSEPRSSVIGRTLTTRTATVN